MVHPTRYDPDDPLLTMLRTLCLALPAAQEKVSHGRPVFFTTKVFAVFGGVLRGEHQSDRYGRSVVVRPDPGERPALMSDPRFFEPAYYGPSGWVGLDLTSGEPDWVEVGELVETSFRNTAPRKLVARLLNGL